MELLEKLSGHVDKEGSQILLRIVADELREEKDQRSFFFFFVFKLGLINSMSDFYAVSHSWSLQKKAATKSGGHEDQRDQSNYRGPESRTKSGLGSICPTIWVIQAFLDRASACFETLYPSA